MIIHYIDFDWISDLYCLIDSEVLDQCEVGLPLNNDLALDAVKLRKNVKN